MDNAFSSKYNSSAKTYYGDREDFVSQINIARNNAVKNAFLRVKDQPKEYKNQYYEAEKAKFVFDNLNTLYAGVDDPREAANARYAAEMITNMFPSIPRDVAESSYRPLIKNITGDDMDASTLMGVAWKNAKNVWNSFTLGGKVYVYSTVGKFFQEGLPDEVEAKRDKAFNVEYELFKKDKGLNQRTDYYDKDYNSFLEKVVLDAAEIIPSEILSFGPEIFGAVLSAVTQNPIFYGAGRTVSKFTSSFVEAGSSAQELYEAGADWDTIRAVASSVGLVNGSLEIIGNIPERRVNEALFGMRALRKAVGETGTELTRGISATVFARMASNYALGLVTEPATEVAQEFVSMYAMNLASRWEQKNKGKSFSDEFTYTPEQMADAMKEIAASTFRGQLLLGLVGEVGDVITNMRKGGSFLYNEKNNTGFKWETGELRRIIETRKYQNNSDSSILVKNDLVKTNDTSAVKPSSVDEKGRPEEKITPVITRNIGGEYVPINSEEMAKANYMKGNSDEGMYIEVVNDSAVSNAYMDTEELRQVINSLPDDVDKHPVEYSYTEQGDIVIPSSSDLEKVVNDFVTANINKVSNVYKTEDGYVVTANGKNINFTTDADNAVAFNQSDYVSSAREAGKANLSEQMTEEWQGRVTDIKERAKRVQSLDKIVKTRAFNSEMNKVYSTIKDKTQRAAEKAKVDAKVNSIANEAEKAINAAIAKSKDSEFAKMFEGKNVADSARSFARGTVMAVAKLAQSMKMNVSDFLNKINFTYSPESMKGGKERAGWTIVNSDGTFDVAVTSFLDQTTGIHEMGHVYLSMLGDNYKAIEGFEKEFANELEKDGGKIGRNTQEAFAEALEQYVNEGKASSEGLRAVFDMVLDALRNFINSVRELLSPEKVAMFDNLFEKGLSDYNPELANTEEGAFYAKDAEISAEEAFQEQYDYEVAQEQFDEVYSQYEGTDQWMKAPNGNPTNLTERQWVLVRTPNFIRWFGDWINDPENASKVLDENGEPLVVYHHTTDSNFAEFRIGTGSYYVNGLYFMDYGGSDSMYGDKTIPVFVSIKHPYYIGKDGAVNESIKNKYINIVKEKYIPYLRQTVDAMPKLFDASKERMLAYVDGLGDRLSKEYIRNAHDILKETTGIASHIYMNQIGNNLIDEVCKKANSYFTEATGYDGFIVDYKGWYIALQSNQVKSINNEGRFSEADNIYFKDADVDMSIKDIKEVFKDNGFVPNEILEKYENDPIVKAERLAQNIVGTKPEWFKLYNRAVDDYIVQSGKSFNELTDSDYKKIAEDWNKRLKGANYYMEIPQSDNLIQVMRRLTAYSLMESPEKAETAWTDALNHTRNGRENIRKLAMEMHSNGLFNDRLEGYDLSARFPALSMIYKKTADANARGVRPRIEVSVYESAKDEAFRNRQYIREQLGEIDSNTRAYESTMREVNTETNYMESADIQEILKDKDVSPEIKELVKNGMWDGTVVRDLMKKATETLEKLDSKSTNLELTERQLKIEQARQRIYQEEIAHLEQGFAVKDNARIRRLQDNILEAKKRMYQLELAHNALSDLYAAEKLQAALYKTRRQLSDMVSKKSGEADTDRALRQVVKGILNLNSKRNNNPDYTVKFDLEKMKDHVDENGNQVEGKAKALADFLESNNLVDSDGKLLRGIEDMDVATIKALKKAVTTDNENSRTRHKAKQNEFEANTVSLASKIVSSMRGKQIDKALTADDKKYIQEETAKRSVGIESSAERKVIEQEVRREVVARVVQSIADGARYGIQAHSEAINKKHVVDDFTTLSRLLDAISPELKNFVMECLNKATDGKYRMVDNRMATFYKNIKEINGLKSDKALKKYFSDIVNTRVELKRLTEAEFPQRLRENELFMELFRADEKDPKKQAPSKFQYSIQELMAIEEQSREWDGLRHLDKGCGLHAAEIAWAVREFENDNGSLNKHKATADEIQRVYAERFQPLYDTVLNVENREMTKVSFYSPMFGVGLNKDLMLKFGDIFGDDKKAQANWFTKDREFGTSPIDLNYYSRLEKVVEMQEAYINGADFYRQLDYLFSDKGGNLRNIISEVYGEDSFKRIETILDLTKSDSIRNIISEADNMASKIRNHYVMARLAYNMSSVFQQVGSWFLGLKKYNVFKLWKSSMEFILHPIEMSKRVYELAPQMKHAINPLLKMAYETGKADPKTVGGKIDKFVSAIGEKGLTLMEKQDHIIRNILWWTSYQDEIANAQNAKKEELAKQGITSPSAEQLSLTDEEQDQCQRNATQWVLDIQSSSQVKDNSLMYSGGSLFWKQILMFTNQLNKEWNMLYVDGIKDGLFKKDFGKFFGNMAALSLATMWVVACTGRIKNDEDDDETWAEDILKDWGFEFASRVPLVGNLTKNVYEGFAYRQNDDIVTRLTQAILTLSNEKAKKKSKATAVRNVAWSVFDLSGAPTTAIKRTYQMFEDGEIFEADHFMRFFGGEWYKYFEE